MHMCMYMAIISYIIILKLGIECFFISNAVLTLLTICLMLTQYIQYSFKQLRRPTLRNTMLAYLLCALQGEFFKKSYNNVI